MRVRHIGGFTLLEMMVVVSILAMLVALSAMALGALPGRARLSGGVLELNAALASARSQSLGRGVRTAVLLDTGDGGPDSRVRYWLVVDPWLTLDDAMSATPGWRTPEDLLPPSPTPPDARFRVLDLGAFAESVRLAPSGFRQLVGPGFHPGCVGAGAPSVELASGTPGGSRAFPPPFCEVPDDAPCTFCSVSGGAPARGAIFFEPDGRVSLVDARGVRDVRGAGSVTFTQRAGNEDPRAIVLLDTGLFRSFDSSR